MFTYTIFGNTMKALGHSRQWVDLEPVIHKQDINKCRAFPCLQNLVQIISFLPIHYRAQKSVEQYFVQAEIQMGT